MNLPSLNSRRFLLGVSIAAASVALPTAAAAPVNGAIYTTSVDATVVNQNIYEAREAVYLSGGPQNANGPGLSPDGRYYFQVTDPSSAELLSTDAIECREVIVSGGRITGVVAVSGCTTHALGVFNAHNGQMPVQLFPFNETPNPGGEYKAWITPVGNYSPDESAPKCSSQSNIRHGFCDSDSKTDNFKVRSDKAAYVTVCKFDDQNANGQQDSNEPLIPHWPITATGVDGGTVSTQTGDFGCVSFTFSGFNAGNATQTITLTEGTKAGWTQTAPADGSYANGAATVSAGVITVVVSAGDLVAAPNFGNTSNGDVTKPLVITVSANTSFDRAFAWAIKKSVDKTQIRSADGAATFIYTVDVTHTAGTDSQWQATGEIQVSNDNNWEITDVALASTVTNGGACVVATSGVVTVPANSHIDVRYTCTYTSLPLAGFVQATASWSTETATAPATVDFDSATMTVTDGEAVVTDTMVDVPLGTVTYESPSPTSISYSITFKNQEPGTCTPHDNVAAFTTNTTGARLTASQSVQVCVGANLTVGATAATSFASSISKGVNKTIIQQGNGTGTFAYTVQVTESGWVISGAVTISNPNDWQDVAGVTLDVMPTVTTASCVLNDGAAIPVIGRSSSMTVPYSCSFATAPSGDSGVSAVTIAWDGSAATTPASSATTSAAFAFQPLTVTDTFNGVTTTLGTVTASMGGATYTYSQTVANAAAGACKAYVNTAQIVETAQSAGQTVNMCNTATGAHTIGFWQNKNGQAILTGGLQVSNVCVAATWLRTFAPFQDLLAAPTCKQLGTYAFNVIKAANASGASMNAMLKAQMMTTAFDVYYSTPLLGGNQTGAPVALGGVTIDLTAYSGGFGGATKMSVLDMLTFAAGQSNVGGSVWYGQVKIVQEFAKNAFDDINNARAFIAQ